MEADVVKAGLLYGGGVVLTFLSYLTVLRFMWNMAAWNSFFAFYVEYGCLKPFTRTEIYFTLSG